MNRTNIEYLDFTWSPIAMRCTPVSEGCANCWHLTMANRMALNWTLPYRNAYCEGESPVLVKSRLDDPLKRKKPAIIGVQFMGDIFHDKVTWTQRDLVMRSIVEADHHIYLLLTKRPKNMLEFFQSYEDWESKQFPYIWLGVTAENQQTADERIPILLQIPAAKRFVSIEPMLGPVDLHLSNTQSDVVWRRTHGGSYQREFIDWIICGGESGSGARPMHPDWVQSVRDQCQEAGVPFFFKQWGNMVHTSLPQVDSKYPLRDMGDAYYWLNKKEAGRLLDGREWNQRP